MSQHPEEPPSAPERGPETRAKLDTPGGSNDAEGGGSSCLPKRMPDQGHTASMDLLAQNLYEAIVPKGNLPEVSTAGHLGGQEKSGTAIPTTVLIRAVGPLLKFQNRSVQAKLVDDVCNISDRNVKSEAILAMAAIQQALCQEDRSRLIDETFATLEGEKVMADSTRNCARALIGLAKFWEVRHRARFQDMTTSRPELMPLFLEEGCRDLEDRSDQEADLVGIMRAT